MLRPGPDAFRQLGGIHKFMKWPGPVLTDSGGYQIFSLPDQRTITEKGARFKGYVDQQMHMLSPERSIEVQTATTVGGSSASAISYRRYLVDSQGRSFAQPTRLRLPSLHQGDGRESRPPLLLTCRPTSGGSSRATPRASSAAWASRSTAAARSSSSSRPSRGHRRTTTVGGSSASAISYKRYLVDSQGRSFAQPTRLRLPSLPLAPASNDGRSIAVCATARIPGTRWRPRHDPSSPAMAGAEHTMESAPSNSASCSTLCTERTSRCRRKRALCRRPSSCC